MTFMIDHTKSQHTIDKQGYIRFDFLFSYWIIIWFLVYYFMDPKTTIGKQIQIYGNPKFAFCIAVLVNTITLLWIVMVSSWTTVLKYTCMILVIKVWPLYLIWNKPMRLPNDVFVFTGLFVLYNIYLYLNDESLMSIYKRTFTSVIQHDDKTPLFGLVAYLGEVFHIDKDILAWF